MKQTEKQDTMRAFDALTRKLIEVPKDEVDEQIAAGQAERKRNRRKKK